MRADQALAVERVIVTVRGQRVILSSDLARIYGVEPRVLNQAIKRNPDRFPPDFAFHLNRGEAAEAQRSRSQFVILKRGGNLKYLPLAFTEHGAIMAATLLELWAIIQAMRRLVEPPEQGPRRRIGFGASESPRTRAVLLTASPPR